MKDYNEADVAFLRMMIPHHQKAVDEAAKAFHAAKSADVKEWARAIWAGQRDEIKKFEKWLFDRGLSAGRGGH